MPCSQAAWWRSLGWGSGMMSAAMRAGFQKRDPPSEKRQLIIRHVHASDFAQLAPLAPPVAQKLTR